MSDARRPAPAPKPAAEDMDHEPETEKPSAAPKLVEVNLLRKYCPHFLVVVDGSVRPNEPPAGTVEQVIFPGIVKLHTKDANIVLNSGVALPSEATWKALAG